VSGAGAAAAEIEVQGLIDAQRFRPITLWYVAVLLLALVADGYDLNIMGFAAPSLVKDWHASPQALGPLLSASLVGVLIGSPLFGALGDRIGRKRAVIAGSLVYGLLSLACFAATNLQELTVLRFLTGVGFGGVAPNVIALSAELAPRRRRALTASLVVIGLNLGSTMGGLVRPWLPVAHEWRSLFVIGGLFPLAVAALIAVGLPESMLFLAQRGLRRQELDRRAAAIDPSLRIDDQTRLVLAEAPAQKASLAAIFSGPFAVVTPLLWYVFAASLFTIFIRSSWIPLVLSEAGVSRERVAVVSVLVDTMGSITGVLSGFLLGRLGLIWPALLMVLGAAGMYALARVGLGGYALEAAVIAVGLGNTGGQAAINATAGLIYPTRCRPTGVGAALGAGRLGAILGPVIGAAIITMGATPRDMFLVPVIPLILAALALVLMRPLADVRDTGPAS
jgi:AAHS family 4-hydroxybenzoate transporter-like MFS transporter